MNLNIRKINRVYFIIPLVIICCLLLGLVLLKLTACYDCCNSNPFSTCLPSINQYSESNNIYLINSTNDKLTHYYYYSNGDLYANYLGKGNDIHIYKTNVANLDLVDSVAKGEINNFKWNNFIPQYYQISLIEDDSYDKYVDADTDELMTLIRKYYNIFNVGGTVNVDSTVPIYIDFHFIEEIKIPVVFADNEFLYTQRAYLDHEIDQKTKDTAVNISDIDYLYTYSDDCSTITPFESIEYSDLLCLKDITLSGYSNKYTLYILDGNNSKKSIGVVDPEKDEIVFSETLTNDIKPIFAKYNDDFYRVVFIDSENKTVSIGIFSKHPNGYTFTVKN